MKRSGRFLARHLWLVALGAIMAGALIFSGPALAGLEGTQKWAFATNSFVTSSPAIGADGTIYVGSYDDLLYALNPNGTRKWAFATGGPVESSPAIGADGTIYVGSIDLKLYAVYSSSPGLANSPWPMFHHDVRHTSRVGYIPPQPQKNTAAINSLLLSD